MPFDLIDNGLRWHVRAFDPKSRRFRDCVITRIRRPQVLKSENPAPHKLNDRNTQRTRIVALDLVSHADQTRPEITDLDYPMEDGSLRVKLRAATAG